MILIVGFILILALFAVAAVHIANHGFPPRSSLPRMYLRGSVIAATRVGIFWIGIFLFQFSDGRQAIGYLLLVGNSVIEMAFARLILESEDLWRIGVTVLIIVTSLAVGFVWTVLSSSRRRTEKGGKRRSGPVKSRRR